MSSALDLIAVSHNESQSQNEESGSDREYLYPHVRKNRVELSKSTEPLVSADFESLDYDICENSLYVAEEHQKGDSFVGKKNLCRWVIFLFIGVLTACIGIFLDVSIEELAKIKYKRLKTYLDGVTNFSSPSSSSSSLYSAYGIWLLFNVVPVLIGSILVAYVEPIALGSGIPQVKCYLNGIKLPRLVRLRTLFVKTFGVITTVIGGLAGAKEGPMIHAGAIIAAGISQGKSTTLKFDLGIFKYFREDREKRDFVSGGAASGVAAAFGAPIGGVLFSLEEGASFWNQTLTWSMFLASLVTTFTLNIGLSTYHGYPGHLSYPGLLNFGKFNELQYELFELTNFILIGALGGLLGALFNSINHKLTLFRMRYMKAKYLKVMEAICVAAVSATLPVLMIYFSTDCKPLGQDPTKYPVQLFCADGEYNTAAALWLQTHESSVRSFFHDPVGSIDMQTMIVFAFIYYVLAVWTYGLSVSAGLFIPHLLIGAAWGRFIGVTLQTVFPNQDWTDIGKYALAGAAAQLGGVVRMTISLTVILIEATGNITFGLPLMIILITAKFVGDLFNEGIYDIHIKLSGIPILGWEPPPLTSYKSAFQVSRHPVVTLRRLENVGRIVDLLKTRSYSGFPVVDGIMDRYDAAVNHGHNRFGRLRGFILRSQLIILLRNKVFNETSAWETDRISIQMFREYYPRYPTIESINITEVERNYTLDLTQFMNPAPYIVQSNASLPRVYRLFRALGLRHIVVIDDENEVIGIITRKDLARYRVSWNFFKCKIEEIGVPS